MLKSLVSKLVNNPEKMGELVSRLTTEHQAAKTRLEAASDAWAGALADEAEGNGGEAATVAAEKELNAAQRAEASTRAALSAATTRHKAALDGVANAQVQDTWNQAETVARARLVQAAKLAKSAEIFAADYITLTQLTSDLYASLPTKPDLDAAQLLQGQIETAVRKELVRLDLSWALAWPWGKPSLPDFMGPFEGSIQVIKGWRDRAMAEKR